MVVRSTSRLNQVIKTQTPIDKTAPATEMILRVYK